MPLKRKRVVPFAFLCIEVLNAPSACSPRSTFGRQWDPRGGGITDSLWPPMFLLHGSSNG